MKATLAAYSPGSCIGISIYDPVAKAGGLLRCMLPGQTTGSFSKDHECAF